MIALVEGAARQKTPNEIALNILLAALTIIFLLAVVTLAAVRRSTAARRAVGRGAGRAAGLPDPDDDRGAAVGDRHRRHGPAGPAQRARDERPRGRGRRRRRRCCWTRPARSPSATGRRPSCCPAPGVDERELADAAQLSQPGRRDARGPVDRRCCAKERYGLRERAEGDLAHAEFVPVHRADPDERRRPRRRRPGPQGRGRAVARGSRSTAGSAARRLTATVDAIAVRRRHAARRGRATSGRRGCSASSTSRTSSRTGIARAVRRAAGDGHPHRHDHRRQPADRAGDRRGGRRRRLPRRGDARGQDRADPQASRRAAGSSR